MTRRPARRASLSQTAQQDQQWAVRESMGTQGQKLEPSSLELAYSRGCAVRLLFSVTGSKRWQGVAVRAPPLRVAAAARWLHRAWQRTRSHRATADDEERPRGGRERRRLAPLWCAAAGTRSQRLQLRTHARHYRSQLGRAMSWVFAQTCYGTASTWSTAREPTACTSARRARSSRLPPPVGRLRLLVACPPATALRRSAQPRISQGGGPRRPVSCAGGGADAR